MRRLGVRLEDGESFCGSDVASEGVVDGESNNRDGYLGRITLRKWSMYCWTHGR